MKRTPHIHTRSGHPDFVDLDWATPISQWTTDRLVDMPEGIHRHVVVFVAYSQGIYAIKELPPYLAKHEFDTLRAMEDVTRHTARAAGYVERPWVRKDEEWAGAVITEFVPHAFPYRHLVSGIGFGNRRDSLLDAFAGLLVELHLAGLYWGDCSLSNILDRWDASSIEAVMIDAETSRIYDTLSRGQRLEDLAIMRTQPGLRVVVPADGRAGVHGRSSVVRGAPGDPVSDVGQVDVVEGPAGYGHARAHGLPALELDDEVGVVGV